MKIMRWTGQMDRHLQELYPVRTNQEIADLTGWKIGHFTYRAKVLGLRKTKECRSRAAGKIVWTSEMNDFLKSNFHTMSNRELAQGLGLKLTMVRTQCYAMGLKRMELEYWTEEQVNYLRDHYQEIGDIELAEIFQKQWPKGKAWTNKHIEKKRKYLSLKRTKQQIDAIQQRNVDNGRFRLCPVKRWEKCGVAQEGEIRYWRENNSGRMVPRIKIGGKFIHWSRYRWEQLHGPVPGNMNVVFADNNPRNMDDANLIIITDGELSARNSVVSSQGLSDNYVAAMLTIKNPELRKAIKQHPELIELKRQQLKLNRIINHETNADRK